jgi:hypothetical protein
MPTSASRSEAQPDAVASARLEHTTTITSPRRTLRTLPLHKRWIAADKQKRRHPPLTPQQLATLFLDTLIQEARKE